MNAHSLLLAAPFLRDRLFYFEKTDSTNLRARCLIEEGITDAVVVASAQTEGRGRLDRVFLSPLGGLYLSAVLPFPSNHALPTIAAACAAAEALSALCCRSVLCKWVNDLLLDNFKVGGILTESTKGFVIVGIGININTAPSFFRLEFPHVSSLFAQCDRTFEPEQAAAAILKCLFLKWDLSSQELITDYKSRLATLGQKVRVLDGSRSFTGTAIGLDDDAALLVVPCGSTKAARVISGDVSIRGFWGYSSVHE